jgi:glycosyltransferase involved in cell wall biosynthesis
VRIALFSGNYNYLREGANQALNTLVRYVEERAGCEVRVYSPVTAAPAFEPAGTLVPVPSVQLPVRGEFRLALGLPRAIRANITRFAPDVVHVSTPDILDTRAQTFAKELGVPVVASLHTRFETYFDYYGLGWLRPAAEAHLRRFYRRSDHVLVPTAGLAAEMRALRGDANVSVWSRGVDRERFRPDRRDRAWRRARGFRDDDVVVLFFGRLVLEKGVETFVSVIRALQARAPVKALVVGAGPAAAAFSGLPDAVLTGHLQGEALARAVASADILLTPSTTEAFGNVVLEAMASGLAVVSADAPSARSLLTDGETGLLCPPRDPAAYVEATARLIASGELRDEMGKAARAASAAYSWDAASESVVKVYRALAGRTK